MKLHAQVVSINTLVKLREISSQEMMNMKQNLTEFEELLRFYALPDIDAVNSVVSKDLHLDNIVI